MAAFEQELRIAAFAGDTAEFCETVTRAFSEMFPGLRYAWLARNPEFAMLFCDSIRQTTGLPSLLNRTIMGILENGRKKGIRPRELSAK